MPKLLVVSLTLVSASAAPNYARPRLDSSARLLLINVNREQPAATLGIQWQIQERVNVGIQVCCMLYVRGSRFLFFPFFVVVYTCVLELVRLTFLFSLAARTVHFLSILSSLFSFCFLCFLFLSKSIKINTQSYLFNKHGTFLFFLRECLHRLC